MATHNYRKITVGDNFSNCIAYVKGKDYLRGSVTISHITPSEKEGFLDVYITTNKRDTILWKTIKEDKVLEFEYDVNFD